MSQELTLEQKARAIRETTNIVGETKKAILDEPEQKSAGWEPVSDNEVKKAVERLNPDPNSLKSRG